ncbi:flagellar basal-body rod protein FlgC [Thermovirga lienii DSM 17291]|jgi:flagellar basal-body rod protein FlgC|uniref:Flagellar basal-body rod protein FlgC n=1 Tax=Thermovirga lienii (strain ATCC BAA-1197 / DSM 17291 / Cas60314) TaxID=580340 RepID=G7V5T1_THELD|nr:flagellar basal body rod protein FlgC [Thermovirga lienii]AER65836.1 flagellar basal-body rod protein FlgC [Thermovirga lienii DSM 17291]MDN5319044.1 flagellar basal-body rod protein FlgC [Thermovirga sp.]MDN5368148.1 flagellar basal-body rod protein FlgC [Thermovirga sp.]
MKIFKAIDIAGSGLTAHRAMMDVISENLANANTTRTPDGGPYQRKVPVFEEKLDEAMGASGVKLKEVATDQSAPRMVYDPGHPDANEEGYVAYPNVSVVREMADMMTASRAYEANLEVVKSAKAMLEASLDLLKG